MRLTEEPLAYAVDAFVSGGRTIRGRLDWDDATKARFEISAADSTGAAGDETDAVVAEVLKLARAVRQTRQERLSRWRG